MRCICCEHRKAELSFRGYMDVCKKCYGVLMQRSIEKQKMKGGESKDEN